MSALKVFSVFLRTDRTTYAAPVPSAYRNPTARLLAEEALNWWKAWEELREAECLEEYKRLLHLANQEEGAVR
jgi:hypothetical protein